MPYQRLTAADQQGIRNALQHVTNGVASAKLLRALEADHFARTLLGEKVPPIEARTAGVVRPSKATGGASPGGGRR